MYNKQICKLMLINSLNNTSSFLNKCISKKVDNTKRFYYFTTKTERGEEWSVVLNSLQSAVTLSVNSFHHNYC